MAERSLPAGYESTLGGVTHAPIYLIELAFSQTLRLSSAGDVTWNTHTWTYTRMRVGGLRSTGGTVSIDNSDGTIGAIVLNEDVSRADVKVYEYRGTEAIELFSGGCSSASINSLVTLTLRESNVMRQLVPTARFLPPVFNHLIAEGSSISWNGNLITWETSR